MAVKIRYKTKIVIIGAGQAGLSAGYHLQKLGLAIGPDFIIMDGAPQAGGAWQSRWDSLTLSTVNRIHDLPGMSFEETVANYYTEVQANRAVPRYFDLYEKKFGLQVGYGSSASTIGANRAGAAAARELVRTLES